MAPPRKSAFPKELPEDFLLTDTEKKTWRLGRRIGQGGCGLIYLASQDLGRPVTEDTRFVIKVEYQQNGPLFSELKFYQRAAKAESVQRWRRSRGLDFLGVPAYWGSGLAEWKDLRYRFMVMERLGSDLQKVCDGNRGRLKKAAVLQLGQRLVDVLEYIHENEYVHADIKAANLMLGYNDREQVYLADYGLSYRYCPDGVHKEYKENPKKGHNGTIEYTSIDAHRGVAPSRRGDLQILGFCLLHWISGSLPWDSVLMHPTKVQEAKAKLMDNLPESVQQLSVSGASTDEVARFLLYIKTLDYQEKPDYKYLIELLGGVVSRRLDFSMPHGASGEASAIKAASRDKKAGGARGANRAQAVPPEGVHQGANRAQAVPPERVHQRANRAQAVPPERVHQRANRAQAVHPERVHQGANRAQAVPPEGVQQGAKPKQVPTQYLRGPPLARPQSPQREEGGVRRAWWSRSHPVYTCEDEEEEEDEGRPKPIAACYLRGPPVNPGGASKQRRSSRPPQPEAWRRPPPFYSEETESSRRLYEEDLYLLQRRSGEAQRPASTTVPWFVSVVVFFLLVAALGASRSPLRLL